MAHHIITLIPELPWNTIQSQSSRIATKRYWTCTFISIIAASSHTCSEDSLLMHYFTELKQTLRVCYDLRVLSRERAQKWNSNSTSNWVEKNSNQTVLADLVPQIIYDNLKNMIWIMLRMPDARNQFENLIVFRAHTYYFICVLFVFIRSNLCA